MSAITLPDSGLELGRLSESQLRLWGAGMFRGYVDGFRVGWEACEQDVAESWAPVTAFVRGLGSPSVKTHEQMVEARRPCSALPVPSYEECQASWDGVVTK